MTVGALQALKQRWAAIESRLGDVEAATDLTVRWSRIERGAARLLEQVGSGASPRPTPTPTCACLTSPRTLMRRWQAPAAAATALPRRRRPAAARPAWATPRPAWRQRSPRAPAPSRRALPGSCTTRGSRSSGARAPQPAQGPSCSSASAAGSLRTAAGTGLWGHRALWGHQAAAVGGAPAPRHLPAWLACI